MADREALMREVLDARVISIRDVDRGDQAFRFTSRRYSPGYVSMKGVVGEPSLMSRLVGALTSRLAGLGAIDFVAGNATGGIIPAWEVCHYFRNRGTPSDVKYVYIRDRGPDAIDRIVGCRNLAFYSRGLVVDELVSFGTTMASSIDLLRGSGFTVSSAACILSYGLEEGNRVFSERGVQLISLFTLPELLDMAEEQGKFPQHLIKSYRDFLADPAGWQKAHQL